MLNNRADGLSTENVILHFTPKFNEIRKFGCLFRGKFLCYANFPGKWVNAICVYVYSMLNESVTPGSQPEASIVFDSYLIKYGNLYVIQLVSNTNGENAVQRNTPAKCMSMKNEMHMTPNVFNTCVHIGIFQLNANWTNQCT